MEILQYIKNRQKNLKHADEVRKIMGTHIYGDVPTQILKRRRPLESQNGYALEYRENNYEPFSKEYFNLAISEITESADQVSFDIKNLNQETKNFESEYRIDTGCIDYNLKSFCTRFLSVKCESDPNGYVVTLPVHPSHELIPDFRADIPDFNFITNQYIDLDVKYISSEYVYYVDSKKLIFKGGEWIYKIDNSGERTSSFYWMLTTDTTFLIIPFDAGKEEILHEILPYYSNNTESKQYFEKPPFHVLGHNLVQRNEKYYYECNFSGAVAYFNKAIGIESDLDVTVTKFVYPREYTYEDVCDAGCSYDNSAGYHGFPQEDETCQICKKCSGTGMVSPHTTPLGTTIIPKQQMYDEEGNFKEPYQFIQPPIDGVEFLDTHAFKWIDRGIDALYLTKQNITNASEGSKSYDLKQKISNRTKGVKNLFRLYQCLLNDMQAYLKGEQNVVIDLPSDFKVKSSEDITYEIVESKGAPSIYTSSLTTELILKRFGNNAVNRKALEFLEINDILYGTSADDALKKKTNYGLVLDARVQLINDKGFFILQKIANENEDFLNLSDDRLLELFNVEIDKVLGYDTDSALVGDNPITSAEDEAKAKLKGTVGGVQGIISINQAVANGEMTENAAELLLVEIYGINPLVAKNLIDAPEKKTEPQNQQ